MARPKAEQQIQDEIHETRLNLIGDRREIAQLRQCLAEFQLNERIAYDDHRPLEAYRWYKLAQIIESEFLPQVRL